MNRVERILPAKGSPTYNMQRLLNVLGPAQVRPIPDKYYVFVYKAKTPNIQYDQHPFIYCTNVFSWGFSGYNFHWERPRYYTWGEVLSNLYEVNSDELSTVQDYPIAYIRSS